MLELVEADARFKDLIWGMQRDLEQPDEDFTPVMFMELEDETIAVVSIDQYLINQDVGDLAKMLYAVARDRGARRLCLALTAYLKPTDLVSVLQGLTSLSESPSDEEVLMIQTVDRVHAGCQVADIIRSSDEPPKLGDWISFSGYSDSDFMTALRRAVVPLG